MIYDDNPFLGFFTGVGGNAAFPPEEEVLHSSPACKPLLINAQKEKPYLTKSEEVFVSLAIVNLAERLGPSSYEVALSIALKLQLFDRLEAQIQLWEKYSKSDDSND